ncbi:hypothetical protein DKX38_024180 [Salix brachista]|uniref:DUSP domain-containing protein n=1 Tax=Salix brachista TaxID=2182728 RepID=A0A5N5JKN9_9ROSI|nr:hypothetical protein DKX38_024180 [Salix brachista]
MTDQSSRLSIANLRTTSKLIKHTASTFSSNLFTLIFLSLLLFSFRTFFENGAHVLSSFIDRDPSLKSLLSRLDLAGRHHHRDRNGKSEEDHWLVIDQKGGGGGICLPCTPEEEKQIVEELNREAERDLKWERYVGQDLVDNLDNGKSLESQDLDEPELVRILQEGKDYVLVPKKVWEKLVQWYKGGPTLPRKMISQGVFNKTQFNVEVYPLRLKLIDSRDDNESTIQISKKASLQELYERVCSVRRVEHDDFFSADDESDSPVVPKSPPNGSYVILHNFDPKFGYSDVVIDNGVKVPEIVRSGIQFKAAEENHSYVDNANNDENKDSERSREDFNSKASGEEKIVDLQFLVKGLELGRRDAAALFFLMSFLSAAYGWVILGFTAIYSWVLGIVFVVVVNDLLGRHGSFIGVVWDGSRLGSKRLAGFILMRWAVRDALTQLVGMWFFGEIEDQYSFFKLFIRLKLMPFSITLPWINGFETEISGFLIIWMLLDLVVGFIFVVDAWVTTVETRRTGREILKEGCYLISTMFNQAVQIKCYEEILCGSAARWVFAQVFGKILATLLQSAFEVYFMVAWLIFYFVARCKDADSEGRRFGRRELKGLIDGLR